MTHRLRSSVLPPAAARPDTKPDGVPWLWRALPLPATSSSMLSHNPGVEGEGEGGRLSGQQRGVRVTTFPASSHDPVPDTHGEKPTELGVCRRYLAH